ncbi:cytochrome P450 [Actinomadura sp. 3N508]|uniref:cytochrome P450 n=1 Tax=Actinomadura sp. 3N508 TaxID=3375153 RepID=UPI00378D3C49
MTGLSSPTSPLELFDEEFMRDPYPRLAELRRSAAAHCVAQPNGLKKWIVTRYEDGRELLADPRLSKNMRIGYGLLEKNFTDPDKRAEFLRESGSRRQFPRELAEHMLDSDPPDHTRLRRLVAKVFTARRVREMRPQISDLADELLGSVSRRTQIDLMGELAFPLPFTVICSLLGVPLTDREWFRKRSNLLVSGTSSDNVRDAGSEVVEYLGRLIAAKRSDPADDLLSALIHTSDDGDQLNGTELMSMAYVLMVAGHETTVNLIGNGALALFEHPDQRALLASDPSLWPSAVEEILRFDGPNVSSTWRFTTEPIVVGDVKIPQGEFVTICLLSVCRDPERYEDPNRFDIRRANSKSLAFGHGIHHCIGAPLARLEGEVILSKLFERFPEMGLAIDADELKWRFSTMMRGLEELPVRLSGNV